jgi:hypothetical protein
VPFGSFLVVISGENKSASTKYSQPDAPAANIATRIIRTVDLWFERAERVFMGGLLF